MGKGFYAGFLETTSKDAQLPKCFDPFWSTFALCMRFDAVFLRGWLAVVHRVLRDRCRKHFELECGSYGLFFRRLIVRRKRRCGLDRRSFLFDGYRFFLEGRAGDGERAEGDYRSH